MPFERAGSQYVSVRAAGRPGTVAMSQAGFRELRRRNKRSRKGVTVHFEGAEQQQSRGLAIPQYFSILVCRRGRILRYQYLSIAVFEHRIVVIRCSVFSKMRTVSYTNLLIRELISRTMAMGHQQRTNETNLCYARRSICCRESSLSL
jgi:hypothetical protein